MTTQWPYRWHVVVEAAHQGDANALWTLIAPAGDAEALTFGLPCSADGKETTHYAMSTAATEEMSAILAELRAESLPAGLTIIEQSKDDPMTFSGALAQWGLRLVEQGGGA